MLHRRPDLVPPVWAAAMAMMTLLALCGPAQAHPASPQMPAHPPSQSTGAGAASAAAAPAWPTSTIHWVVADLPPHFTFKDGRAPQRPQDLGEGEVDGFLHLLVDRMPQFRHEFLEVSLPRFEALARQGETLCSVLHVRTPERLQWLYFTSLYPPQVSRQIHVVVRLEDMGKFVKDGQVLQLSDLLQRSDLVGLLPRNRSYGPRIDKLLATHPERAPRTIVAGRSTNLLPMLKARRMDYTLEYPATVDDYMAQHPEAPGLAKLPVAEGRSTTLATAGCSRTPEGRVAILAIDKALRQMAVDPQRDAWIRAWRRKLPLDAEDHQRLLRYLDERGRGPAQVD
ncbi:conserved hypothetical protein [Roseateles sp. YR242]|uniref:TIGR02285 family protein n=1 Tax=Roseateles sp. YR242 TaxID=1855305 RepID=UPI0008BA9B60|nr:TIGR02285 family protein [Roseateles sp. YR242]SEL76817.1 conserved hypothetical protein [Roseateles sp. YR242]